MISYYIWLHPANSETLNLRRLQLQNNFIIKKNSVKIGCLKIKCKVKMPLTPLWCGCWTVGKKEKKSTRPLRGKGKFTKKLACYSRISNQDFVTCCSRKIVLCLLIDIVLSEYQIYFHSLKNKTEIGTELFFKDLHFNPTNYLVFHLKMSI